MISYLSYFFSPSHLFSLRPPLMSDRAAIILAVLFGAFVILGLVSKILSAKSPTGLMAKTQNWLFQMFLTIGILGFVYIFFATQGVVLLAARFWLLIIFGVWVVWLAFIAKYMFIEVPKRRSEIEKTKQFKKYIP